VVNDHPEVDPQQAELSEEALVNLRQIAALAGHFYEYLRPQVPDAVAAQMVIDWHQAVITDGVTWEDGTDE
jgi:hypothetical protein